LNTNVQSLCKENEEHCFQLRIIYKDEKWTDLVDRVKLQAAFLKILNGKTLDYKEI